jgi:hypothetical protein
MIRVWNHGSDNVLVSARSTQKLRTAKFSTGTGDPLGNSASFVLTRWRIKYGYRNRGAQLGKLPCLCDHTG